MALSTTKLFLIYHRLIPQTGPSNVFIVRLHVM